jgi:threonine/homoserine/homoserine lactone efflux protein
MGGAEQADGLDVGRWDDPQVAGPENSCAPEPKINSLTPPSGLASGTMSVARLLQFAALAAVLIVIPGPSVLFAVSRALTVGRRSALFTVAGNELGLCVQVAAIAFGVGALLERSVELLLVVKWLGAAYLIYLGVQAIRHRQSMAEALAARTAPVSAPRAMRDGFIVGVTNPKTMVFLVVALPEFTGRGAGYLPVPVQMLIVGALFPALALALDAAWAIGGTGGLVLIGLGVSIAATGRKD